MVYMAKLKPISTRLDYRTGLIWAFAAPVCLVIGVNSFMFMKAMLIARKTMRNRKNAMEETRRTLTLIKGDVRALAKSAALLI